MDSQYKVYRLCEAAHTYCNTTYIKYVSVTKTRGDDAFTLIGARNSSFAAYVSSLTCLYLIPCQICHLNILRDALFNILSHFLKKTLDTIGLLIRRGAVICQLHPIRLCIVIDRLNDDRLSIGTQFSLDNRTHRSINHCWHLDSQRGEADGSFAGGS